MSHKYFLTFPQEILNEPVIYALGRDFEVIPNIRGASVSDDQALVAVELEGEEAEVGRAVAWLEAKGVQIEPLAPGEDLKL